MEAYNGNVQFGNYTYSMSGVTTEQSLTHKSQIDGQVVNGSFDGIEYINEQYDSDELEDVEIIAIDPNSFYTSDVSVISSESDADDDENDDQEVLVSTSTLPFDMQSSNDFNIITLNIDDEFIDPQTDDILFENDHQFDLATYIGGECNSLLLSPVNNTMPSRQRLISLSDFTHADHNESNQTRIPIKAAHDKVTKTTVNNRRKRKNLSREFIESSDSETNENSINSGDLDVSKRNKIVKLRKDDDPVWSPCVVEKKRPVKSQKLTVNRGKDIIDANPNHDAEKKNAKTGLSAQGNKNSLRSMLKQQMLSDRPTNKTKLLKTMADNINLSEKVNSKAVPCPTVKRPFGRGKDIEITAKYYNCNDDNDGDGGEASDNSYRSAKKDRFHQIYTDSDESDIEVGHPSRQETSSNITIAEKPNEVVETFSNTETKVVKEHNRPKQSKFIGENKKKVNRSESISTSKSKAHMNKKLIHIDSNSMDSTDFAKALVTNAKTLPKKSSTSIATKKSNLEQQKRLIQSTLLLQNPNKFKILPTEKSKETVSNSKTSATVPTNKGAQDRISVNVNAGHKSEPNKMANKSILPKSADTELKSCDQQIKSEASKSVNKTSEMSEDVKPDTITVDNIKVESSAKRKLNLQEYLKRKNLKTSDSSRNGSKGNFLANIKKEKAEKEDSAKTTENDKRNDNETIGNSNWIENSMYEEIIIVSMGCNTDISIPMFAQPPEIKDTKSVKQTVLLSDIQTTVEKAQSKISSCSLISSIQDVILKKSHSVEQETNTPNANVNGNGDADTTDGKEKGTEVPEHGENKVIMHLRKDRVRPLRATTFIQTDPYFQFPPLEKLTPLFKKQSSFSEKRNNSTPRDCRSSEKRYLHTDGPTRGHRSHRGPSHVSESSYYSDDDEKAMQRRSRHSDFVDRKSEHSKRTRRESSRYSSSKYDRYLSRNRTISRSLSSSSDNSHTSTDSSTTSQSSSSSGTYVSSTSARSLNSYGGSSSKSHYGDDHQYYRKRTTSNNSRRSNYRQSSSKRTNSPEERRIVYVGRIEEATTKEELRRKFMVYGQVKHVSVHHKETKMKYGFITFVRPCDAYTAIDDSKRNAAISHYDISFGGRRAFCREKYFDLDNSIGTAYCEESVIEQKVQSNENEDSFDVLLRKMKKKLTKPEDSHIRCQNTV